MLSFINSEPMMIIWIIQLFILLTVLIVNIVNLKNISSRKMYFYELVYSIIIISCIFYIYIYYTHQFDLIARDLIVGGNSISLQTFVSGLKGAKVFPLAEIGLSVFILISLLVIRIFNFRKMGEK